MYYSNEVVGQRKGRIRSRGVYGLGEVLKGSAEQLITFQSDEGAGWSCEPGGHRFINRENPPLVDL